MFNVLLLSPATLNWIESRGCTGLFIGTAGYVVNPNLGIPTVNRGATYGSHHTSAPATMTAYR